MVCVCVVHRHVSTRREPKTAAHPPSLLLALYQGSRASRPAAAAAAARRVFTIRSFQFAYPFGIEQIFDDDTHTPKSAWHGVFQFILKRAEKRSSTPHANGREHLGKTDLIIRTRK